MIIELRGGTGAGKSTVMRDLMYKMSGKTDYEDLGCTGGMLEEKTVVVLGRYDGGAEINWGGLESHHRQDEITLMIDYVQHRHEVVLMEGGFLSKMTSKVYRHLLDNYRDRYTPIFLATPWRVACRSLRHSDNRRPRREDVVMADHAKTYQCWQRVCRDVKPEQRHVVTRKSAVPTILSLIRSQR